MSNLSDFLGGGKPKRITRYTSADGTGTYVPTADNARCFVRVTGGGGGAAATSYGGGGGATVEMFLRIPLAGIAWIVGAGGAPGAGGSKSVCGPLVAKGGEHGGQYSGWNYGAGGVTGSAGLSATLYQGGLFGYAGGCGGAYGGVGAGTAGSSIGWPHVPEYSGAPGGAGPYGGGGGGSSIYGIGGAGGATAGSTGASATNYGAGGGSGNAAGGSGAGGCIEIWDFGA